MLKLVKILLILAVAIWGYIGAFGNIADFDGTLSAIGAATSMSTWEGGAESWRATENPVLIGLAAALIPLFKLAAGVFSSWGAWQMWKSRAATDGAFEVAKKPALTGIGIAILLLFGGWIVAAETWFEMWRSDLLRELSLQSAYGYIASLGVIALFVALRDD